MSDARPPEGARSGVRRMQRYMILDARPPEGARTEVRSTEVSL